MCILGREPSPHSTTGQDAYEIYLTAVSFSLQSPQLEGIPGSEAVSSPLARFPSPPIV